MELPCKDCKALYIGQTSRYFLLRVHDRKRNYILGKHSSVIANHCIELSHVCSFAEPKILANESKLSKMLVLKIVDINKFLNNIKKITDIQNLSKIYTYMLHFDNYNNPGHKIESTYVSQGEFFCGLPHCVMYNYSHV